MGVEGKGGLWERSLSPRCIHRASASALLFSSVYAHPAGTHSPTLVSGGRTLSYPLSPHTHTPRYTGFCSVACVCMCVVCMCVYVCVWCVRMRVFVSMTLFFLLTHSHMRMYTPVVPAENGSGLALPLVGMCPTSYPKEGRARG